MLRPRNAPKHKYTKADLKRERLTSNINYKMHITDEKIFKSFDEILNYLLKLKMHKHGR